MPEPTRLSAASCRIVIGALLAAAAASSPQPGSAAPTDPPAPTAHHAVSASGCGAGGFDLDGDGVTDAAIGSNGARVNDVSYGAVSVRISNHGRPYQARVDDPDPAEGDDFGTSVAGLPATPTGSGSTATSGCRLAVGAPGRLVSVEGQVWEVGAVFVFDFRPAAHAFVERVELRPGHDGLPGAPAGPYRFGQTLAAVQSGAGGTLFVGAPLSNLGSGTSVRYGVGQVIQVRLDAAARPRDVVALHWGGDRRFDAAPTRSAAFGSALATSSAGLLFIGSPQQGTRGQQPGGAVEWVQLEDGLATKRRGWVSQATRGVAGSPERVDRFGSALAVDDQGLHGRRLIVGVRFEKVGSLRDAGMVNVIPFGADGVTSTVGARGYTQDSAGVAGKAEAGDEFGWAVAVSPYRASKRTALDYLVGSPAEAVGSVRDTGSVYTLAGEHSWNKNSPGIPGRASADDRMGEQLSGDLVAAYEDRRPEVLAGLPIGSHTTTVWQPTSGLGFDGALVGASGR